MSGGFDDGFAECGPKALGHFHSFDLLLFVHVDVVEVAAGARAKGGDKSFAELLAESSLEEIGVIGAVFGSSDGIGVHRENGRAGEWLLFLQVARAQDADVWITGTGRADDVRGKLARIESDFAILHPMAAIEGEVFLSGDG